MADPLIIPTDVIIQGTLVPSDMTIPAGSVDDAAIQAAANLAASKLQHQHALSVELFGPATTITALTRLLHIARAEGQVLTVEAVITVQATGADRTVTVDLQKSTGAGAFATVMTAGVAITNATAVRTVVAGTVDPAQDDYVDNDVFQLVVTVAGAAGAQAQGLLVTVTVREKAQ